MPFRAKVITFTDFATAMRQGNLMRLWTVQSGTARILNQLHALVLALIENTYSRRGIDCISFSFKVCPSLKLAYGFAFLTALAIHVCESRLEGAVRIWANQSFTLDGSIQACAVLTAVCPRLEFSVGGSLHGASPFTVALVQSIHSLLRSRQLG